MISVLGIGHMGWCGIIHSENFPSPIPDVLGDNRFLFSITNAVFVVDLTNVSMVAQNPINMLSIPNSSLLGSNPVFVEFLGNQCRRLNLDESLKDSLDDPCFLLHDGQLLVFHTVSHRNATADPFAFFPAGGHLVANPLGDDLPLILREGDENVEDTQTVEIGMKASDNADGRCYADKKEMIADIRRQVIEMFYGNLRDFLYVMKENFHRMQPEHPMFKAVKAVVGADEEGKLPVDELN